MAFKRSGVRFSYAPQKKLGMKPGFFCAACCRLSPRFALPIHHRQWHPFPRVVLQKRLCTQENVIYPAFRSGVYDVLAHRMSFLQHRARPDHRQRSPLRPRLQTECTEWGFRCGSLAKRGSWDGRVQTHGSEVGKCLAGRRTILPFFIRRGGW